MNELQQVKQEVNEVLDHVNADEMQALCAAVCAAPRVFVAGEGRSGFSARGFAMRLMHLGRTVYFVGETITPAMQPGDLFIGVSGSGTSAHVLADLAVAQKAGCSIAAVTSKRESPLAQAAQAVLVVPGATKADTGEARKSVQLLSSLFDQCLHITLDVVCLMISRQTGMDNASATQKHY